MRRLLFQRYILSTLLLLTTVTCFVACTKDGGTVSMDDEKPLAVSFDTYLQNGQTTRTTYPQGSKTGEMLTDNVLLHKTGFSVFAQYTEGDTYQHTALASGQKAYNFMWNQEVTWNGALSDSHVTKWTYSPVKYWPNDNQPADDQDNDSGNNPATGSRQHSYVSFFAYAPYVSATELPSTPVPDADNGIVAMTGNDVVAGNSKLTYRLPESLRPTESIDLLWSMQPNRYKTDGGGYTSGKVEFQFIHALSKLNILARGVFDHVTPDDTSAPYPSTRDGNTKILIESVEILSPTFYREAEMLLAPQSGDGTAEHPYATVPVWQNRAKSLTSLNLSGTDISMSLLYSGNPADVDDAAAALERFDGLPAGVVDADNVLLAEGNTSRLVMPTAVEEPLQVRVVYYVITYDERLTLNSPKYFSIVKNDITQSTSTRLKFEPNKIYTLRLLLGLTTVKFDVSVGDWAVPIMLNPVVRDPDIDTRELVVQ